MGKLYSWSIITGRRKLIRESMKSTIFYLPHQLSTVGVRCRLFIRIHYHFQAPLAQETTSLYCIIILPNSFTSTTANPPIYNDFFIMHPPPP